MSGVAMLLQFLVSVVLIVVVVVLIFLAARGSMGRSPSQDQQDGEPSRTSFQRPVDDPSTSGETVVTIRAALESGFRTEGSCGAWASSHLQSH
jgi:hypothetical protein